MAAEAFSESQLQQLLWHVCKCGPVAALNKLVEVHGVCLDITNDDSETPLIVGVRNGATDVVRALLRHGPRLDIRASGKTCVEWARNSDMYQLFQIEAIQLMTMGNVPRLTELLDAGLEIVDESDFSPLTWSRQIGTKEVIDLLQSRLGEESGSCAGDVATKGEVTGQHRPRPMSKSSSDLPSLCLHVRGATAYELFVRFVGQPRSF